MYWVASTINWIQQIVNRNCTAGKKKKRDRVFEQMSLGPKRSDEVPWMQWVPCWTVSKMLLLPNVWRLRLSQKCSRRGTGVNRFQVKLKKRSVWQGRGKPGAIMFWCTSSWKWLSNELMWFIYPYTRSTQPKACVEMLVEVLFTTEKRWGRDKLGHWDWPAHTAIYKIDYR